MTSTPTARPAGRYAVVAVCFAAIIFDGYDLIIYGSTLPALLDYEPWALTPSQAGAIGSYALLGMFFGAIAAGTLTDRFGRRKLFLGCLLWYSTAMAAVALAPTPDILGVLRFVAGLGFGGIAPVAIALVVEVARPDERNRLNALMLAGMPVGGMTAALLALLFLDDIGFRGLWLVGALAIVVVFPLAYRVIPETAEQGPAARGARRRARELASGRALTSLVLFAIANFVGFLLVFGLNIWLPELMRKAGFSLGSALTFQILLNIGAIAGGILGASLADRFGSRLVATAAFVTATLAVGGLAAAPPQWALYFVVLLAGAGSIGTQIVLFGYVATYFPAHVRATALGLTTGVGRLGAVTGPLLGGLMLSAGVESGWVFAVFGATALIGAAACLLVPKPVASKAETIDHSSPRITERLR
ncbi:MAG TPA: aromatic acid/H+ symport family MFS transporter [Aldersonia sp.]